MERRVDPIELRNDALHRQVAAMIRQDPSLIGRARQALDQWLADNPLPVWLEWKNALAMLEPDELATFLESTTPRARRMRCSSAFFCLAGNADESLPRGAHG